MRSAWLIGCFASLMTIACEDDDPCDPGQVYQDGVCLGAQYTSSGTSGAAGASGDASTAGSAGAPSVGEFGTVCTDAEGCAEPAPYCAIQLGQTEGFCTMTGCIEQPTVCPGGWDCVDLSVFREDLPAICYPP